VAHRKAAVAKKKMTLYLKISKFITAAVRTGGSDVNTNGTLALAISRAKAANMTKDKIEAALVAATTLNEGANEEVVYEAVQAGGVALIVECLTNSRNRTSSVVKHALSSTDCTLSPVRFLFERRGILRFPAAQLERVTDAALEFGDGVSDIVRISERSEEDETELCDNAVVFCAPASVHTLSAAFTKAGLEPKSLDISWWPTTKVDIENDEAAVARLQKAMDTLDDVDDVARVFHNASF
jgi:YebC/PmpR family DNA-binding regulatory protein